METAILTTGIKKYPSLRFQGFSEKFKKKEFGLLVERSKSKYNPTSENISFPCIELDCISQESGALITYYDSLEQKSIKNKFKKGDILFGKLRPYLKKFLKAPFEGVCSSEIWVLNGIEISNEYLYQLIQTEKFNFEVNITSGSKMPRAEWSYISEVSFRYPSLPEQQKIASFLSVVDKKIQQLNRKKELLKTYKKGVMQKLFSQEIRFKDEERKEFPEWKWVGGNKLFNNISDKNHNSGLPILAITQDQGAIPRELINYNITVTKQSVESYKVVQKGDFVISLRTFQGGIEYSDYLGICSPAYIVLRANSESVDKTFYKFYLKTPFYIKQLQKNLEGIRDGKMISYKYFSDIKLPYPSVKEQQKIADFLSAIDKKIEAVSQQIEKTQTFKKGLLQQMFV